MFKPLWLFAFAISVTVGSALAAPPMHGGMPPLPPQPKVRPAGIPAGDVMVSPCIPGMGEHWMNLKTGMRSDGTMGPIYGTYKGKVIFSEIMVPTKVLDKGFNYDNLTALPGHSINHVDVEYEPHGHPVMPMPHYDIHAYYVSHATHLAMCPGSGSM